MGAWVFCFELENARGWSRSRIDEQYYILWMGLILFLLLFPVDRRNGGFVRQQLAAREPRLGWWKIEQFLVWRFRQMLLNRSFPLAFAEESQYYTQSGCSDGAQNENVLIAYKNDRKWGKKKVWHVFPTPLSQTFLLGTSSSTPDSETQAEGALFLGCDAVTAPHVTTNTHFHPKKSNIEFMSTLKTSWV